MKTQTITSPSGDELVVLARSDYEALVAAAEARTMTPTTCGL